MTDKATKAPAGLDLLREPFPAHQISLLPKPTKKREEMDKLPKAKCSTCGGYHATTNVIHLSYVGHAALTDRLLDADPAWNWEPLAMTAEGTPLIDRNNGLWIKLTVCGVTRLGYGHADDKTGGNAIKEVIGDALRNAAMRFGAALDLWHKGDLHLDDEADAGKTEEPAKEPAKQMPQPAGRMSENLLTDWCIAIKGQTTMDDLQHTFTKAILAAREAGDKTAETEIRKAKDARKAALTQPAAA